MASETNQDGLTTEQVAGAYAVLEQLRENLSEDDMSDLSEIVNEAHYLVQQYDEGSNWSEGPDHNFEEGDYAIDSREPTPSPEANTVKIVELTGTRADEFVTEEGKLVSEYEHNSFYPDDDPVVAGVYPNMSGDDVWHFPESRLRQV